MRSARATVASGWAGTIVAFFQGFGINLPPTLTNVPGTANGLISEQMDASEHDSEDPYGIGN